MHLNFSSAYNVNSPLTSNANCVQGNTHWDCKVQLSISTVRHFVTLKENEVPFTHKIDYVGQITSHIQETCFTALQTSYYFSTNRNKPIKQDSNHTTLHFHIYRNSHSVYGQKAEKYKKITRLISDSQNSVFSMKTFIHCFWQRRYTFLFT